MFQCLLLIPFPKQCKSLKTHSGPISFISGTFLYNVYILNEGEINLLFENHNQIFMINK